LNSSLLKSFLCTNICIQKVISCASLLIDTTYRYHVHIVYRKWAHKVPHTVWAIIPHTKCLIWAIIPHTKCLIWAIIPPKRKRFTLGRLSTVQHCTDVAAENAWPLRRVSALFQGARLSEEKARSVSSQVNSRLNDRVHLTFTVLVTIIDAFSVRSCVCASFVGTVGGYC
jgi:hypothetical protein